MGVVNEGIVRAWQDSQVQGIVGQIVDMTVNAVKQYAANSPGNRAALEEVSNQREELWETLSNLLADGRLMLNEETQIKALEVFRSNIGRICAKQCPGFFAGEVQLQGR